MTLQHLQISVALFVILRAKKRVDYNKYGLTKDIQFYDCIWQRPIVDQTEVSSFIPVVDWIKS